MSDVLEAAIADNVYLRELIGTLEDRVAELEAALRKHGCLDSCGSYYPCAPCHVETPFDLCAACRLPPGTPG